MFSRTVLPNYSPYLQWPYLESNISVSLVQTKCKTLLRECSNFTLLMSYLIEFIAIAVVACMHAVNWGRLHHVFYVILPSSLSDCQIVWLVSKIYRWFCLAVKLKTFCQPVVQPSLHLLFLPNLSVSLCILKYDIGMRGGSK